MVGSSRLHRGAERLYHRMNSIPDIKNIPHYRREIANGISSEEDEPETLIVNLKIDSEEEPETKYVNLFINTKQNVNISFHSKIEFQYFVF